MGDNNIPYYEQIDADQAQKDLDLLATEIVNSETTTESNIPDLFMREGTFDGYGAIGIKGGLTGIFAKTGLGKSRLAAAINSALIAKPNSKNITGYFDDNNPQNPFIYHKNLNIKSVLHFDIELQTGTFKEIGESLCKIAGYDKIPRFYTMMSLKKILSPAIRTAVIKANIEKYRPDVITVDVTTACVNDLSSQTESTEFWGLMAALAEEFSFIGIMIMHSNKTSNTAADRHGYEMMKRCQFVLLIEERKDYSIDNPKLTIKTVKTNYIDSLKRADFKFSKTNGLPIAIPII